jgi:hypothetical protein
MMIRAKIRRFLVRWSTIIQWLPTALCPLIMPALAHFAGPKGDIMLFSAFGLVFLIVSLFPILWLRFIRASANKVGIYNFDAPPRIFMGFFTEEQTEIAETDRETAEILSRDMESIGIKVGRVLSSDHRSAPQSFQGEPMILICGPNGNKFSYELNELLRKREPKAFFFEPIVEEVHLHTVGGAANGG